MRAAPKSNIRPAHPPPPAATCNPPVTSAPPLRPSASNRILKPKPKAVRPAYPPPRPSPSTNVGRWPWIFDLHDRPPWPSAYTNVGCDKLRPAAYTNGANVGSDTLRPAPPLAMNLRPAPLLQPAAYTTVGRDKLRPAPSPATCSLHQRRQHCPW